MCARPHPRYAPSIDGSGDLVGRAAELGGLRALVDGARRGQAGAVLTLGDPGIGKTSLLDATAAHAARAGATAVRIRGYGVETPLAFAALQRLIAPVSAHTAALPPEQRRALQVATGLASGDARPALVGLATLSLLADASRARPLVCVVDDAHHLDAESLAVLGFVARRVSAERLALVVAARDEPAVRQSLAGVEVLPVGGLDAEAAALLLARRLREPVEPAMVEGLVRDTGGNPLALTELGGRWTARRLAAAASADAPVPAGHHLAEHYAAAVRALPRPTRDWLLIAAAESSGDVDVVRAAAHAAGLGVDASAPAEVAGLVEVRDTVTFRHPLLRTAVYGGATDAERRRAHTLLSAETAARGRRAVGAIHAASAARAPDATIAAELAAVADLAGARGGMISRARLLERAASFAADEAERSGYTVSAAEAALVAGAPVLARVLLADLDHGSLDPVQRGRARMVTAWCGMFLADPDAMRTGTTDLLAAADDVHDHDPALEQRALAQALDYTQSTEGIPSGAGLQAFGARLRRGAGVAPGPYSVALDAVASLILDAYEVAVPRLRAAVALLDGLDDATYLELGYFGVTPAIALWEPDVACRLLLRTVRLGREVGALREVDAALWVLSSVEAARTRPRHAAQYLAQAADLRQALGHADAHPLNPAELAGSGAPRAVVQQVADAMRAGGFGGVARMGDGALAARDLASGDWASAFDLLGGLLERPYLQATFSQYPDYVEAAARLGRDTEARAAAAVLDRFARATGARWASGTAARAAALVAGDGRAEEHYLASIAHLDSPGLVGESARSRLLYGEWLRRARRRGDARAQLRLALDVFEQVGSVPFADRARRELRADGDRALAGTADPGAVASSGLPAPGATGLTPQEASVARMAARGATNPEIASALFISPNTVDYHLRKVFRKLGITSRRQLREHPGA